jgi:hypothetical protein
MQWDVTQNSKIKVNTKKKKRIALPAKDLSRLTNDGASPGKPLDGNGRTNGKSIN